MKVNLTALISGLLFGAGLALSGMMNPAKVIGFLDLFGDWDPSLALVMGGALAVMAIAVRIGKRFTKPILDDRFHAPATTAIDRRLILGAVLFGLGWGIAGLCPGPAIAALVTGATDMLVFVAAMIAGMIGFQIVSGKQAR